MTVNRYTIVYVCSVHLGSSDWLLFAEAGSDVDAGLDDAKAAGKQPKNESDNQYWVISGKLFYECPGVGW